MNLVSTSIRYFTFILAIAGVLAMGVVLQKLRSQDAAIPPPPVQPPKKQAADDVAATGILEARDENVAIGVPISGLVKEVKVIVNQVVKKDDPLLILDDRELTASLLKQKAAIAVAEANLVVSQAQLAKVQDMLDRLKSVPTSVPSARMTCATAPTTSSFPKRSSRRPKPSFCRPRLTCGRPSFSWTASPCGLLGMAPSSRSTFARASMPPRRTASQALCWETSPPSTCVRMSMSRTP